MHRKEGITLLVVPVKEDEFSVLGHSGIHRTGVVDDYGTSETSVCVFIHADIAVVGPELRVFACVRGGCWWDEPLVNHAASRCNSIPGCEFIGTVGIQRTFAVFGVEEAH